MRWKRVAWAGCLAPVVGGCHTAGPAAHDLVAEKGVARTEAGIEREIRRDAREAWDAVRSQYPGKAFTPEFRDGFRDGYVDYLDRGGDAQPPAVPPPRYTRNKKYFTPEGHALIRDYFLGFKYGVDVAVATGQRQYLTVPVLIPDKIDQPVPDLPVGPAVPPGLPAKPAAPLPVPRPLPVENPTVGQDEVPFKTSLPAGPKPSGGPSPARPSLVPPPDPGESKFGPVPKPPTPTSTPGAKIPPPVPSVPIPPLPGPGAVFVPAGPGNRPDEMVSKFPVEKRITAAVPPPDMPVTLPEPPASVPDTPARFPVPSGTDDLPVLPPNHTVPPPLPANHPDVVRR